MFEIGLYEGNDNGTNHILGLGLKMGIGIFVIALLNSFVLNGVIQYLQVL